MKKPGRAFTFAEAILTVALVFFVFNLTAGLLTSYLRTARFASGVDKAMEAAQNALTLVSVEAAQALSFLSPTTAATRTLSFNKVWTENPTRLPDPLGPFPANWEPRDPAWLDTVTYSLSENRLLRRSLREQANAVLVSDQIGDFQVRILPTGNLWVEVSVRQDDFNRRFSTEVFTGLAR